MRLSAQGRRGDTLIEVIFALAILATILTVITTGAVTAWRTSRAAGERAQAAAVVSEQAEALRAYQLSVDWSTFRSYFVTNGSASHMEIVTDTNGPSWDLKPNSIKGEALGAPIPSVDVSFSPTPPVNSTTTEINLTITAKWRSAGSTTESVSSQNISLTENR